MIKIEQKGRVKLSYLSLTTSRAVYTFFNLFFLLPRINVKFSVCIYLYLLHLFAFFLSCHVVDLLFKFVLIFQQFCP